MNDRISRRITALIWSVLVFSAAFLLLLAGMDRTSFNIYDEGVIVLAAERIIQGEAPYRDFWTLYTPGQFWTVAGLFEVFGTNLLVERLWDVTVRAGIVLMVFLIVARLKNRPIAILAALLSAAWLWAAGFHGYPLMPAALFTCASARVFIEFIDNPERKSCLWVAGALAGIAAMYRHDIGFYIFAAEALTILLVVKASHSRSVAQGQVLSQGLLSGSTGKLMPLALGALLAGLPTAIILLWQVSIADLWEHLIALPATIYADIRRLPYPALFRPLEMVLDGGLSSLYGATIAAINIAPYYIPIFIPFIGLVYAIRAFKREGWTGLSLQTITVLFITILIALLFIKGFVRASPPQMIQVIVMSIVLAAILPYGRLQSTFVVICMVLLAAYPTIKFRYERPPPSDLVTIERSGPIGIPPDQAAAIRYIQENVPKHEAIFVGNDRHDKILLNDVIFYFFAERRSAVTHHELSPGVVTTAEVQKFMISELNEAQVNYIALYTGGSNSREPNLSSVSSGVFLLDNYIEENFETVESWGQYIVKKRRAR